MFDQLKNLGNIGQLMARAGEMRERMTAMQEEMGKRTVTGDSGAGMVTATVNGRLELTKLKIDRTRFGPTDDAGRTPLAQADIEMLEDLVCAAVRSAQGKAAAMMQEQMGKLASEMGLPAGALPGM